MTDPRKRFSTKDKDEMTRQEIWEEIQLYLESAGDGIEELEAVTETRPDVEADESATEDRNTEIQIATTKAIAHLQTLQELHEEFRSR